MSSLRLESVTVRFPREARLFGQSARPVAEDASGAQDVLARLRASDDPLPASATSAPELLALDGVSLDVRDGETVALVGPSGCGKSTLLRVVAGLQPVAAGRVLIDEQDVTPLDPKDRGIGMVFQNYALFPHMTIAENIAFPLRMRKMDRQERTVRIRSALQLVRLPDVEGRYPQQLSGGQQQRIALARALVYDPPLLLMDEPLGALDKQLREELQLEIKHLQNRLHITVIYVTHDQSEALVMSDRIAVFNHGRVEQLGTPEDLYDAPANRFVASFLGESNFLEIDILGRDGEVCTARIDGGGLVRLPAANGAAPGQRVTMAVRPEKIVLGASTGEAPNAQRAIVREVIFEGEVRRYEVRLDGGATLILKQVNRQGSASPARGDTVTLGWHDADARMVGTAGAGDAG